MATTTASTTRLEDIFTHDAFTRTLVEEYAQKHRVCPFEFSLDLSLWTDIIICDYNYVFDPRAFLKRFFQDAGGQYAFLIDEAHNLVDRAREMFSADLNKAEITGLKRLVGKTHPDLGKQLDALNRYFAKLGKKVEQEGDGECWISPQLSTDLMALVHNILRAAEKVLEQGAALPFWDELIECYFRALGFERIGELFDEALYHVHRKTGSGHSLPAVLSRPSAQYPPGPRARLRGCILLGHALAAGVLPRPARRRGRGYLVEPWFAFPARAPAPAAGRPH